MLLVIYWQFVGKQKFQDAWPALFHRSVICGNIRNLSLHAGQIRCKEANVKVFLFCFVLFLTFLLEYNCFKMVCQFLLYNKVSQLYIYICPHISSLLRLPPSLSHPSRWSQSTELNSLCYVAASHQLSILCLVVYICPCHSLTLSQRTLPLPRILKSILQQICVFIPVLPLGSS